jgi:transposase
MVLGAAEGASNAQLVRDLGTTKSSVLKWRARYLRSGLEGILEDAPRSGRKKTISAEKEAAIVEATLQTRPTQATHWSTRSMADAQGVSDTTVHRIWKAHRLQPHRIKTFKFSRDRVLTRRTKQRLNEVVRTGTPRLDSTKSFNVKTESYSMIGIMQFLRKVEMIEQEPTTDIIPLRLSCRRLATGNSIRSALSSGKL